MSNELIFIDKILTNNPNGIKACDIANKHSISRTEVNRFLYSNLKRYRRDENYKWYLRERENEKISYEESDPILVKLNNRENAKEFELEDYLILKSRDNCKSHIVDNNNNCFINKTGIKLYWDSAPEKDFLLHLNKSNAVVDFRGQNFLIKYGSRDYWPDYTIYTKDKHIAIIEAKPVRWMSYLKNIRKYKSMAELCQICGYEYMMYDIETGMTFEEFKYMNVDKELEYFFKSLYENDEINHFDKADVKKWHALFKNNIRKKTDLYLQVESLIIRYEMCNYARYPDGFDVYKTLQPTRRTPKLIETSFKPHRPEPTPVKKLT